MCADLETEAMDGDSELRTGGVTQGDNNGNA